MKRISRGKAGLKAVVLFAAAVAFAALPLQPAFAASIEVYGAGGGGGGGGGGGSVTETTPGGWGGIGGAGGIPDKSAFSGGHGGSGSFPLIPGGGGGGDGGGALGAGEFGGDGLIGGFGGLGGLGGAGGGNPGTAAIGPSGGNGGNGVIGSDDVQTSAEANPDSITVAAGSGGMGGDGSFSSFSGIPGNGGAGGSAFLTLSAPVVNSAGVVSIRSGQTGLNGLYIFGPGVGGSGGAAGAASLTAAGTLGTPSLMAVRNNGPLNVAIGSLDVSATNTVLVATGTAPSDFAIGTIRLSGGRALTVANTAGSLSVDTLTVGGIDNAITIADTANLSLTHLTFVPDGLLNGNTALTADNFLLPESGDIALLTLDTSWSLAVGESVVLIDATGTLTGNVDRTTTINGKSYSLATEGNRLTLSPVLSLPALSGLTSSAGTLSPSFDGATTTYTLSIPNSAPQIVLTPTTALPGTTIVLKIDGSAAGLSDPILFGEGGSRTITIEIFYTAVPAQKRIYTVTATRAASAGNPGAVEVYPTAIAVVPASRILNVGETVRLSWSFSPANTTITNVTLTSSSPDVAAVDGSGLVTAKATGISTIGVRTANDRTATSTITVRPGPVSTPTVVVIDLSGLGLADGALRLNPGQVIDATIVVTPDGTKLKAVGLPEGITLDEGGHLHGVVSATGSWLVVLTAAAPDGAAQSGTFVVRVENAVSESDGGSGGGCNATGLGFAALGLGVLPLGKRSKDSR